MNEKKLDGNEAARELTHALFDLSGAVDLAGRTAAGRLGLNQTDLICLSLLVRDGPTSPGRLARALGLTSAAISALAARLEAAGYARREMDPTDRRRVLVSASAEGARSAFSLFDDLYAAATALGAERPAAELDRLTEVVQRFGQLVAEQARTLAGPPARPAS